MNPGMVHAHYQALDWDTAIVLAWIEGGEILGIAEVHPYPAIGSREAEIALALDWDRARIGEPLMACALRHAAAAGARHSWMLLCRPDPAQFVIARKLGGKFDVAQDTCSFTHGPLQPRAEGAKMIIHRLSIADQVTGPEALRCPELHDLSEVVRGNRLLLVVLAIAAMLTAGHFVYHGQVAPMTSSVGLILVGASARQAAREEGVPMASLALLTEADATAGSSAVPATRPVALSRHGAAGAMFSHGEDDDQPAGACWLASAGGTQRSCLCSVGSIEDLVTPDFMRGQLTSWRDAGRLTTGEWRERLQEVDAACVPRSVAP
jgi:hypothetical protein